MSARTVRWLSLVLVAGVAAALAWAWQDRDDSLTRLQKEGVIRIGYAVEPPYAFLQPDGDVTGEAPEIARRMAVSLNVPEVEWRQMEFGKLIDQLEAGQIDVIAAGLFITDERARRVLFSDPTYQVRPGLLVTRGNPKRILSYRQAAERPDIRVAVLSGAVEEQIMRRLAVPTARLVAAPDVLTGLRAVETGLADVLILSEPTVRWMARGEQLGRTEAVSAGEVDVYGHTAFAFRKRDRQLRDAWNGVLRGYLGSADHRDLLVRLGLDEGAVSSGDNVRGERE